MRLATIAIVVWVVAGLVLPQIRRVRRARRAARPYRDRARDRRAPFLQEGMPWDPETGRHVPAWAFYDRLDRAKGETGEVAT